MSILKCKYADCTAAFSTEAELLEHHREHKRGTVQPEVVDMSNGALYLLIDDLRREVRYLSQRVSRLESNPAVMRIGGGE